jgi:hypothetical protein
MMGGFIGFGVVGFVIAVFLPQKKTKCIKCGDENAAAADKSLLTGKPYPNRCAACGHTWETGVFVQKEEDKRRAAAEMEDRHAQQGEAHCRHHNRMSDQRYYEIVAEELQRKFLRPGLWARAVAEAGGEGDAARALYIRLRVAELIQQEMLERTRAESEAQKQEEEEVKAKLRRREAEILAEEKENRRRAAQIESEQRQRDWDEAASPYIPWLVIGFIVVFVFLFIWLSQIFSK